MINRIKLIAFIISLVLLITAIQAETPILIVIFSISTISFFPGSIDKNQN